MCKLVTEVLHNVVQGVGFSAYSSAQQNACTCISEDPTTSSQQIKPKINTIDNFKELTSLQLIKKPKIYEMDSRKESTSIFQHIYGILSFIFSKFINFFISLPIFRSFRAFVKPVLDFFIRVCENMFGSAPLESEAGFMDILSFLKQCYDDAYAMFVDVKGLIGGI